MTNFKIILVLMLTATLAIGCASASYESEQSSSGSNNGSNNSSGDYDMDTDGDGENDSNSGELNLNENKCIDFPTYEACDPNDSYILNKCNTAGEMENIECEFGCADNKCLSKSDNSCQSPYLLTPEESASGHTENGENYSSACTDLETKMAVVKFEIPEVGFYELTTRRITETSEWGQVLSRTCDPSQAYSVEASGKCSVGQSVNTSKQARLFNPGSHYLFIAPHNLLAPHFKFSVSLKTTNLDYEYGKVEPIFIPAENGYQVSDSTKDGAKVKNWPEGKGCKKGGNNGAEKAYAFAIDKTSSFTAELTVSDSSTTSQIGMHLYSAKDTLGIVSCSDTEDKILYLSAELEPGEYVLFVDGVNSETYDYDLSLTLE